MNKRNIKTKKNNPKGKYIIHSKHDDIYFDINAEYYQIISIDPGEDNFAFRIERRYNTLDGKYHSNIITIETIKISFTKYRTMVNKIGSKSVLFQEIIQFLNNYKDYYNDSCLVIVENQMNKNTSMVIILCCVINYFLNNYNHLIVLEIDSHMKSKILDAPKGLTRPELKKWDIEMAKKLLMLRGDNKCLSILNGKGKSDDMADVIIQIEALFKLLSLPLTNPNNRDCIIIIDDN